MTPTRKKRLILISLVVMGVGVATAIFLTAFKDNMMFFKSPTEVSQNDFPENRSFRLGGMVKEGSLQRIDNSLKIRFSVTDYGADVQVEYEGILPDLFREGQGVVTIGQMREDNVFAAEEVLAKHDENYMPPEVSNILQTEAQQ
ncbi:cytochrome c maturation protein CcmE [Marinicella gelatinilytica]|uniref:cytochrome c maturation protein CcmE n=1 Tax=Marinicella gelatinilytica TaxID=2996017 RepID=UPI002260BA0E|nr:cytochrome c maturation protein CcmE [Marinicella gelatinilytica]MCX7543962.1 cytochrome c maturation protein CcmE [Marinicella gelatinilytica]